MAGSGEADLCPSEPWGASPLDGHNNLHTLEKFLLLAVADIGIAGLWFWDFLSLTIAALVHIFILAALLHVWSRAEPQNLLLVPVGFVSILFTGPLGAAGVLLLALLVRLSRQNTHQLDEWYSRLQKSVDRDGETRRYQSISSGRARSGKSATRNFGQIMRRGTVREKQAVLGIIALKYKADFYPFLQTALRDSEPAIRVSAAAVFARLRMAFKTRLVTSLPQGSEVTVQTGTGLERFTTLQACISSRFLDRSELTLAREAAKSAYFELAPEQLDHRTKWQMAKLLVGEGSYDEAIALLRPELAQGGAEVIDLYREAIVLGRRFNEASQLDLRVVPLDQPAAGKRS